MRCCVTRSFNGRIVRICVRCCVTRSFNGRIVYVGSQSYVRRCVTTVGSKIIKVCVGATDLIFKKMK